MERIVELVEKIEAAPANADPLRIREDARDLVREVLAFHAGGLRRLVELLDVGARGGKSIG